MLNNGECTHVTLTREYDGQLQWPFDFITGKMTRDTMHEDTSFTKVDGYTLLSLKWTQQHG